MLIREFFDWADRADAEARADAAGALAKAVLYAELDSIDAGDATRALTLLLDDPSPLVRRAIAEAFAAAVDAPHHILAALASDRSDIAAIVLERSPVLSDAELIDAVAIGDAICQCAVARRPRISAALAGALAEVGAADAVLTLSHNAGAELTDFAIERIIARFGRDGALREALCRRDDLGPEMRHAIVAATAEALGNFAVRCGWMPPERAERVLGEARDRAAIVIASVPSSGTPDLGRFVAYLRSAGHLTPALVLRALLSGHLAMVEALVCELSGKPPGRVGALLRHPHGLGFVALYKSTGLPASLMAAFQVALAGTNGTNEDQAPDRGIDGRMVERVIAARSMHHPEDGIRLTALLRRFEVEAARDEARVGHDHLVAERAIAARRAFPQAWVPTVRAA